MTFTTADQFAKAKLTTSSATEVKGIGKGNRWDRGNIITDTEIIRDDFYLFIYSES